MWSRSLLVLLGLQCACNVLAVPNGPYLNNTSSIAGGDARKPPSSSSSSTHSSSSISSSSKSLSSHSSSKSSSKFPHHASSTLSHSSSTKSSSSHATTSKPTLPPGACTADCQWTLYNWINVYWRTLEPDEITTTVTAATVQVVINKKTNTTKTITKYNTIPANVTQGPTNAAGTAITSFGFWGQNFTLAFPTNTIVYPQYYYWDGVLQTTGSAGEAVCSTRTREEDYSILPTPQYLPSSPPAPQGPITPAPDNDKKGQFYLATASAYFPEEGWYQSVFPGEAAFTDCSSAAVAPTTTWKTALFLTETETVIDDNANVDPGFTPPVVVNPPPTTPRPNPASPTPAQPIVNNPSPTPQPPQQQPSPPRQQPPPNNPPNNPSPSPVEQPRPQQPSPPPQQPPNQPENRPNNPSPTPGSNPQPPQGQPSSPPQQQQPPPQGQPSPPAQQSPNQPQNNPSPQPASPGAQSPGGGAQTSPGAQNAPTNGPPVLVLTPQTGASPATGGPVATGGPAPIPQVIGTETVSINSASQVVVGGQTLTPGATVTFGSGSSATPVTVQTNAAGNTVLVVGSSTVPLTPGPAPTPVPQAIVIGTATVSVNSGSQVIVGGQTLAPGATVTLGSGPSATPVVLTTNAAGSTVLVVGGTSTIPLAPGIAPTQAPGATAPPVIVFGSSTYTATSGSVFVIGTQTITAGGPAVTVSGTVISIPGVGGTATGFQSTTTTDVGGYIISGLGGSPGGTSTGAAASGTGAVMFEGEAGRKRAGGVFGGFVGFVSLFFFVW